MKKIGKGLTYLKILCGYLNMPPPLQIARFNSLQNIDGKAYETVITDSMNMLQKTTFYTLHCQVMVRGRKEDNHL